MVPTKYFEILHNVFPENSTKHYRKCDRYYVSIALFLSDTRTIIIAEYFNAVKGNQQ